MTRAEIIKETAEFYNTSNRGFTKSESTCEYLTPDGRKCAVGRCIKDELIEEFQISNDGETVGKMDIGILNACLKEEYKGHELKFWFDLQCFHDMTSNWNSTGLTQQGEVEYKRLLEKYQI